MSVSIPNLKQHQKLCELVQYWQQNTPHARAIVFEDQVLSYSDFAAQIDLCAKELLSQGVSQGDVVALYAQPSIVFAVQLFACARIGAIWLGLNTKYSAAELDYILTNATPKSIWLEGPSISQASEQVQSFFNAQDNVWSCDSHAINGAAQLLLALYDPSNTVLSKNDVLDNLNLVQLPSLTTIAPELPTALIYTSGTTGNPKGAVISQYALTKASILQAELLQLQSPSILNNLPINHIGSVGDITTSMIASGGCVVMQSRFDVREGFQLIKEHGITLWGQIPTMFQMALAHEDFATADLSSLECILFSGAPASVPLVRQLRAICPKVVNAYGMSETVGSVTWAINTSDHILATTVGKPIASVEFRLADETDSPVAVGQKGEIQIRSDYCFSYYWRDEAATKETFTTDGYLKTGDLGQENPDGTIMLAGRTQERFKSGGYNVYPREIETVLSNHPMVADAVVVSVPDPLYHEVGYAFVVSQAAQNSTESELKEYCKKSLANYKVPKHIEFLPSFPQLANGKIDRKALAVLAAERTSHSTAK